MLKRKPEPKQQEPPAPATRAVSFTLPFGEDETLQTVQAALVQARCLGVPDSASVCIRGGYALGSRGFTAYFSWNEPMVRS